MDRLAVPNRASIATRVLEEAWGQMRRLVRGLPPAVITFVDTGGRRGRLGHFAAHTWKAKKKGAAHEVAINPGLFATAEQLLMVLLHEAAHAVLFEEDPHQKQHYGGCSLNDPYYHTEIFKLKCEALGLRCELRNRRYGYADTSWPNKGVPQQYKGLLALLRAKLPRGTFMSKSEPEPPQWNPLIRLTCKCADVRVVYIRRREQSRGGIQCQVCGGQFVRT